MVSAFIGLYTVDYAILLAGIATIVVLFVVVFFAAAERIADDYEQQSIVAHGAAISVIVAIIVSEGLLASASQHPSLAISIGGKRVAPNKLVVALKDSDEEVRRQALEALIEIGEAEALANFGQPAVPQLMSVLKNSGWYENEKRRTAVEALGRIGMPALPTLINELKGYKGFSYNEGIGLAIEKIGASAVPSLIATLSDSNWDGRDQAAFVLGRIGDSSAVPALITVLKDWGVRQEAIGALGEIGQPALPTLIVALRNSDKEIRSGAAEALEKIGDKSAVPSLKAADHEYHNDNHWVCAFCNALRKLGAN